MVPRDCLTAAIHRSEFLLNKAVRRRDSVSNSVSNGVSNSAVGPLADQAQADSVFKNLVDPRGFEPLTF